MGEGKEQRNTGKRARRFALHAGLLFAAMVAIFVAAGAYHFFPLALLACVVYILLPFISHRALWKKGDRLSKESKLGYACTLSGMATGLALNVGVPLLWVSGAYRWDESGAVSGVSYLVSAGEVIHGDYSHKVGGAVVLLLLSALLLGLALAFRPIVQKAEYGGSTTQFRGLGAASVLSFWLFGFVFVEVLELLFVLSKSARQFFALLDQMTWDRVPTTWDLFSFYPALPLGILVTAVMVIVLRDLMYQFDLPSDGPAVSPDGEIEGTPVKLFGIRVPGFAAAALAGFLAVAGTYTYYVHVGTVAAAASVQALITSTLSRDALDGWIAEQYESGRTAAEIVAVINDSGHWSPDAPDEGLARLLQASSQEREDTVENWTCPVTVAAGPIDTAELEAAPWPDMSALPPHVSLGDQGREEPEDASAPGKPDRTEEAAASAVRYCLKAACPSPVAWPAPDAIALYSSHPSAGPHWMYPLYFDLYADGVAAAPGGYCTVDGELATSFQG